MIDRDDVDRCDASTRQLYLIIGLLIGGHIGVIIGLVMAAQS